MLVAVLTRRALRHRNVRLRFRLIIQRDWGLGANQPSRSERAPQRFLCQIDGGVVRAALRLGDDEVAAEELDGIAWAEDADLDQPVILRPRPLTCPDWILHVPWRGYHPPRGASTPRIAYTRWPPASRVHDQRADDGAPGSLSRARHPRDTQLTIELAQLPDDHPRRRRLGVRVDDHHTVVVLDDRRIAIHLIRRRRHRHPHPIPHLLDVKPCIPSVRSLMRTTVHPDLPSRDVFPAI